MPEVTSRELAAELEISQRSVSRAVDRGVLIPLRREKRRGYIFDLEDSVRRYKGQDIPTGGNKDGAGEDSASQRYSRARAEEKEHSAEIKRLELLTKRGELVERKDVERDAAEFMAALKSALLAIPDRIAPQYGAELHQELTRELAYALDAARSKYAGGDPENSVG